LPSSPKLAIGGQDHMYLEGHIALAIPGEDDDMTVFSSTQHPSEVQHMVGHVLGIPSAAVTVNVRRMGGGFGGKETQSNQFAAIAAVAAKKFGKPVKIRPDRDDDMITTGKRHDFVVDYDVGYDDDGRIEAVSGTFAARCGFSADLSGPVTDRALFHADNAYYYPHVLLQSQPIKTNTVSNTAFRGFGGPQGLIVAERIMEEIAYKLGKDPLEVRRINFYDREGEENARTVTPYHQKVTDNIIHRVVDELEEACAYQARRESILAFNETSPIIKKGIALTPVKFGISFTATWYNQAGALVHVYRDGSVHLNHGGTEMGQGLNTKVAQVVADTFQIDVDKVKITATTTEKVPNTSATAASSGSDLNGMAADNAAGQIKDRLIDFACDEYQVTREQVVFEANVVRIGNQRIPFPDLVDQAYMKRIHLSAAGFYKTPGIHWNRDTGQGNPFYYFAYGAAVSEVSIDTLTGEYHVDRTDLLHDVGKSLNPAIDIGQVEGAFIQGMGWLTTEELWWDDKGQLRTHAPSTYKIPLASDRRGRGGRLMARLEAYRGFAASAAEHGFVLVRVVQAKGSTPRNTDAWMLVSGNGCFGTIGGGRLELEAIDRAREVLAGAAAQPMALPLGPAIGQCCGGHVTLSFEVIPPARFDEIEALVAAEDARDPEVWLFGGGHVGRALAAALLLLPVKVHVAETRADELDLTPMGAERHLTALPESLVAGHCAGKRGHRADPRPCAGFPDRLGGAEAR
jgi:xanthine dehydrogenase large subunit